MTLNICVRAPATGGVQNVKTSTVVKGLVQALLKCFVHVLKMPLIAAVAAKGGECVA